MSDSTLDWFINAVAWREEVYLHYWFCTFAVLLGINIFTRKHITIQTILFLASIFFAWTSQRLHAWGSLQGGRHYFKRDYFDGDGVFVAVLWAAPWMLLALISLINLIVAAGDLLIKVKRAQLKQQKQQKDQKKND
eukprot:TRINITY_DN14461_c0_g1_i1.p1 TRINITY_DN14461_c0_g1~~TRINITY_DN14461_c0_g1_i1.p1  ORF type:complete len:136 (-),score=16.76 TRINITY_DN14461_c0_g1_i1:248-655(-)